MFSSYFQYISLIQYAEKYIVLVGAHKLQKHSLQNEKVFHSSVTITGPAFP